MQQDEAYQLSLQKDREKQRLLEEQEEMKVRELAKKQREEELRQKEIDDRKTRRENLKENFKSEPSEGEITRVVIRLADGSRLQRKFLPSDKVQVR
jgi:FAS-associated factor 2